MVGSSKMLSTLLKLLDSYHSTSKIQEFYIEEVVSQINQSTGSPLDGDSF